MAHFVGIKASSAGWATGTPITQSDMWQLDSNLVKAINGDDGGAWSPTGAINIGGAYGIVMAAPLVVNSAVLTLTGTASISAASAAYTLGAGTFSGVVQFNQGFTVADGGVEFGNQSITEVLGQWQFTWGFTSLGDTVIGASSGTHTLVVRATETHHGSETHNGTEMHTGDETHTGRCVFQGQTFASSGNDASTYEFIATAADVTRAWDSANLLIVTMTASGCALRMSTATASGLSGIKKTIRSSNSSTYSFLIIDQYSGLTIGEVARNGQLSIVSDANRWY